MHPADAEKRGKLKLLPPPQPKIKDEEFPTSLQEVDRCYLTDVTGVWSSVMKSIQENCWSDNKILITWRNIASGACPDTPAKSSSVPYLPPTALFQLLVCIGEMCLVRGAFICGGRMGLALSYQAVHKARWEREAVNSSDCVNPGGAGKNVASFD